MSSGVEGADVISWAGQLLSVDSAFTTACPGLVHLGAAPPGSPDPVCALFTQSAVEMLTVFGQHIFTDVTLMVKIMAEDVNFPSVRTAAARAYALLHRKNGGAQGAIIVSCILTQQFPLPEKELVDGKLWISFVQLYRVLVQ